MRIAVLLFMCCVFSTLVFSKTYTIGIVPQQSHVAIAKDWKPIIDYLQAFTGDTFVLKTERSIPEFEKILYSGGYDIAYMNPYHYVIAHKKQGYTAAIRSDKDLTGVLVVKKNSPYKNVSALKGKHFLFPAPDAFAATLLIKYELLKYFNIDLERDKSYSYVNSHDSVYKGVARDIGDAGGGIERTLYDLSDSESKEALLVVHKTKSYPSHPIAFKAVSVSKSDRSRITNAFVNIPSELLSPLKMKRLIQIDDSEYDSVRDIAKVLPRND